MKGLQNSTLHHAHITITIAKPMESLIIHCSDCDQHTARHVLYGGGVGIMMVVVGWWGWWGEERVSDVNRISSAVLMNLISSAHESVLEIIMWTASPVLLLLVYCRVNNVLAVLSLGICTLCKNVATCRALVIPWWYGVIMAVIHV